jgi:2-polyprenyl-3-methyl-5-hydroxy-6-metoxy-1,4-benzoquinol methylase
MNNCKPIESCLACGHDHLELTLDLGSQPLANNFRDAVTDSEDIYPLAVNRCVSCDHLQLTHVVNPDLIYRHYLYVSGTSQTYLEYMNWYAEFVDNHFAPYPVKSVLDIGCNDGSQLDAFKRLGYTTFGVDPAENLYARSTGKGHTVWCDFWDSATTAQHINAKFEVITCQNAFAHNPEPLRFLQLVRDRLAPAGKIFLQTSQADMVLNSEFDTIYHEHISFYNAESMRRLADRAGLHLTDVIKTPIHGTSYIFVLSAEPDDGQNLARVLSTENQLGLHESETYELWAHGVGQLLTKLHTTIEKYRMQGYHIVGYGAAAKGMTLLSASGIHLDAVVDDNPLKQGKWCPGPNIPVVTSSYIAQIPADQHIVFVPLAWNFYAEIVQKIHKIRSNPADVFLRYFPEISTESFPA